MTNPILSLLSIAIGVRCQACLICHLFRHVQELDRQNGARRGMSFSAERRVFAMTSVG